MAIAKRWLPGCLVAGVVALAACSSGEDATGSPDVGDDAADASTPADSPSAGNDVPREDANATTCEDGDRACSEDAFTLRVCEGGEWTTTACMADQGKLCREGECVEPWRYDAPEWPTCPDVERGTPEDLRDKAQYYDDIGARLHVHPEMRWAADASLPREVVDCPDRQAAPCHGPNPAIPQEEATWEDVVEWHTGSNDGAHSGRYLASQALRYAVTGSPEVLDNLRLLMEGLRIRMEITGVPGLFTRQFVPPGIEGLECPSALHQYVPDPEKIDNQWVKIDDNGCATVRDADNEEWVTTDHCGPAEYAGWCFKDNVSVDEYASHMFALGIIARTVDDPDIQDTVRDLVGAVGHHLMDHDLTVVDWDGRITQHGRFYPMSFTDFPGFNALVSMAFVKLAAELTGDEELDAYYHDCLLQESGEDDCLNSRWELQPATPFTDYLSPDTMGLYIGEDDCKSNFNNFDLAFQAMHTLLLYEHDPDLRRLIQGHYREMMRPEGDHPKAAINHDNPWYYFMWAALKAHGPDHGHDLEAVERGICAKKQFPARQYEVGRDHFEMFEEACKGRKDTHSIVAEPIEPPDRCLHATLWAKNPFRRQVCTEKKWLVHQPGDYLLTYWMGRYYGFISEDL
ncbi:MAG: hypothetical protein ACQEXJ_22015 [Myxococcota bacterium]